MKLKMILRDYAQAEKYYLMAVEKKHVSAMHSLAWFYFEQKRNKQGALKYGKLAVKKFKNLSTIYNTLACVYLWHNQIKQAIQMAKRFMYDEGFYETDEDAVILYLRLLIAKHQYQYAAAYFNAPDLHLKDRLKPLYYALLYFINDKDYAKRPPEIVEPINDIIKKIKQMAVDYA
jgi:TPR repeat protein